MGCFVMTACTWESLRQRHNSSYLSIQNLDSPHTAPALPLEQRYSTSVPLKISKTQYMAI